MVLFDEWNDRHDLVAIAIFVTAWVFERRQCDRAAVERKLLERPIIGGSLPETDANVSLMHRQDDDSATVTPSSRRKRAEITKFVVG